MVNYYGSITVDYEHGLAQFDERATGRCGPWEPGCRAANRPR
ncbi:hypothetical protein [Streptomyces sp. Isolate_45]|nr:hypothetical protein [Streptomyces sp. Isolate_45]MDA5284443.1 hypothetical protein [Streptomyces sp. Isolate_45]